MLQCALAARMGSGRARLLALVAAIGSSGQLCCAAGRVNLLWIIADDFGFNDIGYHNAQNEGIIRTPHLDRLAASGVKLENAFSQPICTPTRSQALSGRHQIHTGLQHGVIWPLQPNGLPLNETVIAAELRALGYRTHAIGKWHVGDYTIGHVPTRRGFDR
eukprot:COSAG03_NODE_1316_length_4341_cov_5.833333_2_plen_161_part_00